MSNRKWHKGPPPHVGWWNASNCRLNHVWRWWDGKLWSRMVKDSCTAGYAGECAGIHIPNDGVILWTDYWPAKARVPRTKP